jgi:hypothetical protein
MPMAQPTVSARHSASGRVQQAVVVIQTQVGRGGVEDLGQAVGVDGYLAADGGPEEQTVLWRAASGQVQQCGPVAYQSVDEVGGLGCGEWDQLDRRAVLGGVETGGDSA